MKKSVSLPVHVTADFYSPKLIEDSKKIRAILLHAAKAACSTPLKCFVHKFPHGGMTGVVLLAESHIALHTWPEHNYMAVDIFTCGQKTKPERALSYLKKVFFPKKIRIRYLKRGRLSG